MKKRFFYYLLVLAVLGGCASLKAKREVLENTFYSSYPEIQIKVGSEFEYIGETKEAEWRQYQDSTSTDTIRKDFYIFAQTDEERVKKSVVISVHKTKGYWVGDLFGRIENYYDRGTCKLGGVSWQYCSRYLDASKPGAVTKFAAEQGYVMPECLLIKHTSKAFGPKNNYLITISYIEEPPTSDYACHFWKPNSEKPNGGLEYSQLEYIEQFHKNAETSFKIVELGGQKLPKTDLHQELEKESFKIASVPEGTAKVSLRTEPKKLAEKDIRKMLARYDFYDDNLNWRGSFTNDFVDNGDGTITDRATGLMWQKSGSSGAKLWKRARTYVKQLNEDQFAGYSDWRLPTIDELASLVERETVNEVHIDPIFYDKQKICWSADKGPPSGGSYNPPQVWHVNFREGSLELTILPLGLSNATTPTRRYIRAVRSLK